MLLDKSSENFQNKLQQFIETTVSFIQKVTFVIIFDCSEQRGDSFDGIQGVS